MFGLKFCLKEIQLPPDYLLRCNTYIFKPNPFLQNKISVKVERNSRITIFRLKVRKIYILKRFPTTVKSLIFFPPKLRKYVSDFNVIKFMVAKSYSM